MNVLHTMSSHKAIDTLMVDTLMVLLLSLIVLWTVAWVLGGAVLVARYFQDVISKIFLNTTLKNLQNASKRTLQNILKNNQNITQNNVLKMTDEMPAISATLPHGCLVTVNRRVLGGHCG